MITELTHYDIFILLCFTVAIAVFGLGFIAWMVRDVSRIARALGVLIIQETGTLRRD